MFESISHEIIVQAIIAVIAMVASWGLTRLKRKGVEIPEFAQPYLGDGKITYSELKELYDDAERLYRDPQERRTYFYDKLQNLAKNKLGYPLPPAVANLLIELAVSFGKTGWKILQSKFIK